MQTADYLPLDRESALLVGRAWLPGRVPGPAVVTVRGEHVVDLTGPMPLVAELMSLGDAAAFVRTADGPVIGHIEDILFNTLARERHPQLPFFLSPVDLQSIKACGVTFAESLIERVIEEKCAGDAHRAADMRRMIEHELGDSIRSVKPRTAAAERLRHALIAQGLWSQYLEVGIGPDAEIFTKAQPMSSVGLGAAVGILRSSRWNNPEPEVALAVSDKGRIVGALLANDVNLRDIEGRSALLLGRAKDNNASCALGPFIRLLDERFTLDDVRALVVTLRVAGTDGFLLEGASSLARISRDIEDLVAQAIGPHHQYPDGLVLLTGTMFAPTCDRDEPGSGFTHRVDDVVSICSPRLGALHNRVDYADAIAPWQFGTIALVRNLAARGYLRSA